jgi:hypothetical protein
MSNKAKLAFDLLEQEMEVFGREEQRGVLGGTDTSSGCSSGGDVLILSRYDQIIALMDSCIANGGNYSNSTGADSKPWYGNFLGPGPDVDPMTMMDSSTGGWVMPINELDKYAQSHDLAYFKAHTGGITGALFNQTVAPDDAILTAKALGLLANYARGGNDSVTKLEYTTSELAWAVGVAAAFGKITEMKSGFNILTGMIPSSTGN